MANYTKTPKRKIFTSLLSLFFAFLLLSCTGEEIPDLVVIGDEVVEWDKRETVFGTGGGLSLGGDSDKDAAPVGGIGVNVFLWRASLDVLSSWPISSADPFGGVIITDWYAPPKTPTERFKLNIFILDRALRADGIRVSVFRQVLGSNGQWQAGSIQKNTLTQIENSILTRARQFRAASLK